MAVATRPGGGYIERPRPSGLADVLEIILDKGLVIDAYVRVSLIGIEILTIDARIEVASVDTYLRFAQAVNRLDIANSDEAEGLPELMESVTSGGAKSKTRGALEGVKEQLFGGGDEDDDKGKDDDKDKDDDEQKSKARPRRRSSSSAKSSSSGSSSSRSRSRRGSSG